MRASIVCLLLGSATALQSLLASRPAALRSVPHSRSALAPLRMEAAATEDKEEEDRLGAGGKGGHAVPNQPELSEDEKKVQMAVMEHQKGAARLSQAEDARSLVAYNSGYAVLSTLSAAVDGYPSGSLVGFAIDERGLPVFCFSSMSSHTKDLNKGGAADGGGGSKAALCVTAKGFEGSAAGGGEDGPSAPRGRRPHRPRWSIARLGARLRSPERRLRRGQARRGLRSPPRASPKLRMFASSRRVGAADGRVTLIGDVARCSKEETEAAGLRELYKAKHPNAFWADFGDFTFYRMTELKAVNFVGGFARAGQIAPDDYMDAAVDAIQAFAAPVMGHMNADHSDSTIAMVQHYIGLTQVEAADLVALDRLGFMVQVTRQGQSFKLRLPFPRAAEDRKDVKTLIVQMTQAALQDEEVQAYLTELKAKKEAPAPAA